MITSFLDRLTAEDREVLGSALVGGAGWEAVQDEVAGRPWRLVDLLSDPLLLDAVVDPRLGPGSAVSPALLFAVFVCHAAAELRAATHVAEWVGPHARVPVFDVEEVQEFLEAPGRVLFLVDLLTSFADAGPMGGIDDLVAMAAMVDQSPRRYRRLADLALFLAGVFPDRTLLRPSGGREAGSVGGDDGCRDSLHPRRRAGGDHLRGGGVGPPVVCPGGRSRRFAGGRRRPGRPFPARSTHPHPRLRPPPLPSGGVNSVVASAPPMVDRRIPS